MKFQDSSFNGLKVTIGTKSVMHAPTHGRSKSNMPHQLFQSWGHNHMNFLNISSDNLLIIIFKLINFQASSYYTLHDIAKDTKLQCSNFKKGQ